MVNLLEKDIKGHIGTEKYKCTISWRNGTFIMDEPVNLEGKDLGPDPYSTLLASLAGCTLSTLRMYIDRKGWEIPVINISLNLYLENNLEPRTVITREISFPNTIEEDIKKRLLIIAEKCPVSKILKSQIVINTTI